jgi:hypothetical protein
MRDEKASQLKAECSLEKHAHRRRICYDVLMKMTPVVTNMNSSMNEAYIFSKESMPSKRSEVLNKNNIKKIDIQKNAAVQFVGSAKN